VVRGPAVHDRDRQGGTAMTKQHLATIVSSNPAFLARFIVFLVTLFTT
jgi:hypothetical protein